ncbi:MAG: GspH/FimT family pseudopilin [Nevskia sp.]|nr:GspH/FimT family pseudopilin [Nevskia sp.]
MQPPVHAKGFTLLELMVVLAAVAILVTVGLPSFGAMARQNCTVTSANTMLTVLLATRSEALKRDRAVALCKTVDGAACSTAATIGWDRGYLIYLDDNDNGRRDAAEPLLKVELPLSTCAAISSSAGAYANSLSYDGLGKTSKLGNFKVVAKSDSSYERRVVISPGGRPRICNPALAPNSSGTACPLT